MFETTHHCIKTVYFCKKHSFINIKIQNYRALKKRLCLNLKVSKSKLIHYYYLTFFVRSGTETETANSFPLFKLLTMKNPLKLGNYDELLYHKIFKIVNIKL